MTFSKKLNLKIHFDKIWNKQFKKFKMFTYCIYNNFSATVDTKVIS